MDLLRCLVAVLLLAFSGQSLALFMPAGFQINADTSAESTEAGC